MFLSVVLVQYSFFFNFYVQNQFLRFLLISCTCRLALLAFLLKILRRKTVR